MKILFPIISFFPAQSGGPSNTVYWLTKALTKTGQDVCVITTNMDIPKGSVLFNKWTNTEIGQVYYAKEIGFNGYRGTFNIYHFSPKFLFISIRTYLKYDIIHLSSFFHFPSTVIGITAAILNRKVIWSIRGEFDSNALKFSRNLKLFLLTIIKILNIHKRITFHATCDLEVEHIRNVFGLNSRVILLPNYMELPSLIASNKNKSAPYLLFVGRIHPIKGIDNLIKALSLSRSFSQSKFTLLIAGSQTLYSQYIENLVSELHLSDKVLFIGHINGLAKQVLYSNAYFLFLPSHTENFGNVVIESLAQGTPVVASKGTPWQELEENHVGYWCDNSPESLSKAIDNCLTLTATEYLLMRKKAREYVEETYDVFKNVDKWNKMYHDVYTDTL